MRKKEYNVIVFSDDRAEHRQFRFSKRLLVSLVGFSLLLLVALGVLGYFLSNNLSNQTLVDELSAENAALKQANDRYLEASIDFERRLKQFDERTDKLAQYVGVEKPVDEGEGVGGPDPFEHELNPYLRYDLGLLERKVLTLEEDLDLLEDEYRKQSEILEFTPSILPTRGWLSSGMGYRTDPFTNKRAWHNGLDISTPTGTPVYAPASGVVVYKGYNGGFGNLLVVDHGNGIETKYAHLSGFNVSKGQRIKRGDLIAYVGDTGRSTSSHLHYEIHKEGKVLNPMKYIIRDTSRY